MQKSFIIVFLIVFLIYGWINLDKKSSTGHVAKDQVAQSDQGNTPIVASGNLGGIAAAIEAVKPIPTGQVKNKDGSIKTVMTPEDLERAKAQKIALAAPLTLNALKECPKPIEPEQITSQWENETTFCPGMPARMCPESPSKARTPMQLMPATIQQYAKPGEDPETLQDSMKIAVRHLCFAKGKGGVELIPSSDAAILRYNASPKYLESIRDVQAKHKPIWDAIKSGKGPTMVASTATSPATVAPTTIVTSTPANTNGFMPMVDHPEKKLRTATGIDGTPTAYPIAVGEGFLSSLLGDHRDHGVHGGNDVTAEEGIIIAAAADGVVEFADWNHKTTAGERAGIHVLIAHNIGSRRPDQLATTSYMHCQKALVTQGQKVVRGQPIALVGRTAVQDSGSHLHWQATKWDANGNRVLAGLDLYFDSSRHNPLNSLYAGPNTDAAKTRAKQFEELAMAHRQVM